MTAQAHAGRRAHPPRRVEGVVIRAFFGAVVLASVLASAPVSAAGLGVEGMGRVSVTAGYKWTPNWYFEGKAAAAGYPLESRTPGLGGSASFGYGVSSWLEVAIDLLGGWETFTLAGHQPFSSVIYGGLLGARVTVFDAPFRGLVPHFGVQAGPTVAQITSITAPSAERVLLTYSVNAGLSYRLTERFAITADVRWVYARVQAANISGANIGGVFFTIGATVYFPGSPERKDLSVPGF